MPCGHTKTHILPILTCHFLTQTFKSLLDSVASNDLAALYIHFEKHQHSFERKYQSHPVAGADLNLKTHLDKAFQQLATT